MVRARGDDRSYKERDPIKKKKKANGKVTFEFSIYDFLIKTKDVMRIQRFRRVNLVEAKKKTRLDFAKKKLWQKSMSDESVCRSKLFWS